MNKTNKIIIIFLIIMFLMLQTNAYNTKKYNKFKSIEEIIEIIIDIFPESYEEFMTVTYSVSGNRLIPDEATFLIPSKYFDDYLTDKELDKRLDKVMQKLGFRDKACAQIEYGNEEEYSWLAWEDRIVRKITIKFFIEC